LRDLRIPTWQTGGQAGIVECSSLSRKFQYWIPLEREEHVFVFTCLYYFDPSRKQKSGTQHHVGKVDFMKAKILSLKKPDTYRENIKIAAKALISGKIVAFPTETVYGLGVSADNNAAIDNLYDVKQRLRDKKLSIMIARPEDITKHIKQIPPIAEKLISAFWPGPLTIIFELDDNSTVGLRNPDNRVIRDLINAVEIPIASTSANISGRPPAIDSQQVISNFSDKIDVVLDGGPADAGTPSTIVKIIDDTFKIVRHGVIGKERLNRCLNEDCFSIRS